VVVPAQDEPGALVVPCVALIGHDLGAKLSPVADELKRIAFRAEHGGQRLAVALTDGNHALALAALVLAHATHCRPAG
jgi:hypothetical protein